MASMWKQIGRTLGALAVEKGPALLRQLQSSTSQSSASKPGSGPARPITARTSPTAHRARKVEYSPRPSTAMADPGEIVWTWVAYEEDPTQGKDRPVLVVGRDGGHAARPDVVFAE